MLNASVQTECNFMIKHKFKKQVKNVGSQLSLALVKGNDKALNICSRWERKTTFQKAQVIWFVSQIFHKAISFFLD
jgi:hypothetical protein